MDSVNIFCRDQCCLNFLWSSVILLSMLPSVIFYELAFMSSLSPVQSHCWHLPAQHDFHTFSITAPLPLCEWMVDSVLWVYLPVLGCVSLMCWLVLHHGCKDLMLPVIQYVLKSRGVSKICSVIFQKWEWRYQDVKSFAQSHTASRLS